MENLLCGIHVIVADVIGCTSACNLCYVSWSIRMHTPSVRTEVKHRTPCTQSHCTLLSVLCNMDSKI